MIGMAGFKKSYGLLGGAVSCLVALSLLVGTSCAPLCAGAVCPPQDTSTGTEAVCHGMTGHKAASFFLGGQTVVCQLGDAGVAIVGKTGFSVDPVAAAVEFLAPANFLRSFVGSSGEVRVSNGPPGIISSHTPSLVLRV